jgi:hypothetical protein
MIKISRTERGHSRSSSPSSLSLSLSTAAFLAPSVISFNDFFSFSPR